MTLSIGKKLLKVTGVRSDEILEDYNGVFGKGFVGGLPATMTRDSVFDLMSSGELLVTPKADGVRLLCYMNYDTGAAGAKGKGGQLPFFVDRGLNVYRYGIQRGKGYEYSTEGVSLPRCVLDGEMVEILGKGGDVVKFAYLIFDVLRLDGNDLSSLGLSDRLQRLRSNEEVMTGLLKTQSVRGRECIFAIKPYYNVQELSSKKNKYAYIEKAFLSFCKKTIGTDTVELDGLIVADSTAPYVPSCTSKQYKWKPAHQQTVDVSVGENGEFHTVTGKDKTGLVEYKYRGGGGKELVIRLEESEESEESEDSFIEGDIVELVLTRVSTKDGVIGARYMKTRTDKVKPNATRTINDVVESVLHPVNLNLLFDKASKGQLKELFFNYFSAKQLQHFHSMKMLTGDNALNDLMTSLNSYTYSGAKLLVEFPNLKDSALQDSCVENKGFPKRSMNVTESPAGVFVSTGGSVEIQIIAGAGWVSIDTVTHKLASVYGSDVKISTVQLVRGEKYRSGGRRLKRTIFKVTPFTNIIRDVDEKENRSIYLETVPGEDPAVVMGVISSFLLTLLRSDGN